MSLYRIIGRDTGQPTQADSSLVGYRIGDVASLSLDAPTEAALIDAGLIEVLAGSSGLTPARFVLGGGEIVATRPGLTASAVFSSGVTNFATNNQSAHTMLRAVSTIRLVYRNGHHETDNINNITVIAQVSTGASGAAPFVPVWFRGSRSAVLEPGATVISDALPVDLAAGASFYVHTYQVAGTSQSGEKYLINFAAFQAGEFGNNTASDQTGSQLSTGSVGGLIPLYIVAGQPSVDRKAMIGIYGDSIAEGKQDTNSEGFFARALKGSYGYLNAGLSSEAMSSFVSLASSHKRRHLMDGITAGFCNYGINDVAGNRTLAQMQGNLATVVGVMRRAGARAVTWTTLLPNATSSDSFATAANQTPGANESVRVAFNDWLRTQAGQAVDYVFEAADVLEVDAAGNPTRNGGRWAVGSTPDGVHPGPAGVTSLVTPFQNFLSANSAALGI